MLVTLAKNACVNRMVQLHIGLTTKAKVSAGEYQNIAREVEEEFGLDKGEINPENLRCLMYSGHAKFVAQMGPKSPFAGIEAQVLTFVLACGKMRQTLSAHEGLRLANSLVAGTFHKNKLKEWKSGHLKIWQTRNRMAIMNLPTTSDRPSSDETLY
jgi:hypothetical protein